MSIVCPTVTCQTDDLHEYRRQMEKVEYLADRLQVDLMDGDFTPTKSPEIDKIWFPESKTIDLHLMYRHPSDVLNEVLELKPSLLIVHAEASFDMPTLATALHAEDIKVGLALLQDTDPSLYLEELEYADHVLIFSGDLGRFGGAANLGLLKKVAKLKKFKPSLEIGWDGGVNDQNIKAVAEGGIDVINAGGFIQNAEDAKTAYELLTNLLQS